MSKIKTTNVLFLKTKNKRINLLMVEVNDGVSPNKEIVYRLSGRRLVDRKTRDIAKWWLDLSEETFTLLHLMFTHVVNSKDFDGDKGLEFIDRINHLKSSFDNPLVQ